MSYEMMNIEPAPKKAPAILLLQQIQPHPQGMRHPLKVSPRVGDFTMDAAVIEFPTKMAVEHRVECSLGANILLTEAEIAKNSPGAGHRLAHRLQEALAYQMYGPVWDRVRELYRLAAELRYTDYEAAQVLHAITDNLSNEISLR